MVNSDAQVLKNQKTILGNQDKIQKNQISIITNQETIVSNQASIISNQNQIVDNQVSLSVILQTQAIILNLVKNLAGQKESQKSTAAVIEALTAKTQRKAKKLNKAKAI